MSAMRRQQGVAARTANRRQRVRAPHPRELAAVLLCSLLTAGTAPGSPSPGGVFNAELARASGIGIGEMAIPDPAPSRPPSPADPSGASPTTPGKTVVVTSPVTPPAPVSPVVVSTLASDGIPVVASRAYQHAADLTNQRTVGCGIPWTLLAAIGRVESDHGRFAGSVLLANGLSTPRIIGIPLNGVGTGLVLDTDHGVLDGDPVYDHAVGPMQFIPSTWAYYATDGNGDGVADPFNIYDAAAAAAKYLCNAGADLRTRAGRIQAVLTYNHSDSYVASVLSLEETYAGTPIIVEPISGTPILSAPLPPVNPGAPPAIYPKVLPSASHSSPPPQTTMPSPSKPTPTPSSPCVIPPAGSQLCQVTPTRTTPASSPAPAPTPTPTDAPSSPAPAPTPTPTDAPSSPTPSDVVSSTLTAAQKTKLAAIAEEEKLAHDLYVAFADTYPTSVFSAIVNAETQDLAEVRVVLTRYALADPTAGPAVGTFMTASTQQLYNELRAKGTASEDAAYAVARAVESTEITDLKAATTGVTVPDVLQVFATLLDRSQRHLVAVAGLRS